MADSRDILIANLMRSMADMMVSSASTRAGVPISPELVEAVAVKAAPKVKRTVSRYQREFGRQYKRLRRAYPKTAHKTLMKKAHTATKRVLK